MRRSRKTPQEQQEKFFETYVQVYLPEYVKKFGSKNISDALDALKAEFSFNYMMNTDTLRIGELLDKPSATLIKKIEQKEKAFAKYVDKKFKYHEPTQAEFRSLLGKISSKYSSDFERMIHELKNKPCRIAHNQGKKIEDFDNTCSYRHPFESDDLVIKFKTGFRTFLKSLDGQDQHQKRRSSNSHREGADTQRGGAVRGSSRAALQRRTSL